MSEKITPREASKDSENFYQAYGDLHLDITDNEYDLGIAKKEYAAAYQSAVVQQGNTHTGKIFESSQELDKLKEELREYAADLALNEVSLDLNLAQAEAHYKNNEAAYHDAGVAEAMLDGVHINVQQSTEVAQAAPVHVAEQR